jgi:hypothetical protein
VTVGDARYAPRVRELFAALPACGALPPGPGDAIAGEAAAIERGAWVRFEARVEAGRLSACRFRAFGCPHTLAAAAFVASALDAGGSAGDGALGAAALARALDVPPEKMGRLLVVEDALSALLAEAARVQ